MKLMDSIKLKNASFGWLLLSTVGLLMSFYNNGVLAAENRQFPAGAHTVYITDQLGVRQDLLKNIAPLVTKSIAQGYYPGAVILVAHKGQIIYRGVFGNQRLAPSVPMRFDTIFDLASLTKVVATTTAIMQLVEAGKLDLDIPVAHYWPAFAQADKGAVTPRELLTHTSGFEAILPAWEVPQNPAQRAAAGLRQVEQLPLMNPPGKVFTYSDINFVALGYLVELISGEKLDQYAQIHIFKPLKMSSTTFLPPPVWQERIAPTYSPEMQQLRWGQVNDPTSERMGGVAGVAGLFADAEDLGRFLQCLLDGGRIPGSNHYLLGPLTILKMTTPQTPLGMLDLRGLGWDIDSGYSNRGVLLPTVSFGHTGWTGTSVWLDPNTQTWIVILASRTYPQPAQTNQLIIDRRAIANIVAGSLVDINTSGLTNTGAGELQHAYTKFNPTQ